MTAWLNASGGRSGAIFRRIRGTKAVGPVLGQAVWLIVKRRAQLAGWEGDFGAHSLRSGYVTEAGRQNVPLGEAIALTGHLSMGAFFDGGLSELFEGVPVPVPVRYRGEREPELEEAGAIGQIRHTN
jgi:hypothetical protein